MKKTDKIPSKYISIAVIIISALIIGCGLINDTVEEAKNIDISSGVENSPIGDIVAVSEEIGKIVGDSDSDTEIDKTQKYPATFIRAKDGDTYVVKTSVYEITVRLIGVDTPESVAPSTYSKENTQEGKTVSEIVKNKLSEGQTLYVEFDTETEDKYGRVLAYVYLEDGTIMQDWLLENGYAKVMTVEPNTKYKDHFLTIEAKAREEKKGLWNGFFDDAENSLNEP